MENDTVDGRIIQTLDDFIPCAPENFKVVFFFQELRRVDTRNQTPQHDMSRARCFYIYAYSLYKHGIPVAKNCSL